MKLRYLFIYTIAVTVALRLLIKDNTLYYISGALAGAVYGAVVGLSDNKQ